MPRGSLSFSKVGQSHVHVEIVFWGTHACSPDWSIPTSLALSISCWKLRHLLKVSWKDKLLVKFAQDVVTGNVYGSLDECRARGQITLPV
jgi:hypothetical protein